MDGSTLASFLPPLRLHMDPALVPDAPFSELGRTADLLPASMGLGTMYFECDLRPGLAPKADFAVTVFRSQGGAQSLASLDLPSSLPDRDIWERLSVWSRRWDEAGGALEGVERIFLEVDIGEGRPTTPSLFIHVPRPEVRPHDAAFARELFRDLVPPPRAERHARALLDVTGRLGPGLRVDTVGLMLSRDTDLLRLNVALDPEARAGSCLGALEYGADLAGATELAAWLEPRVDRLFMVDVDVGDGAADIQPQVGFECLFEAWSDVAGDGDIGVLRPRPQAFLEDLAGRGLCSPAWMGGIARYVGMCCYLDHAADWPEVVAAEAMRVHHRRLSCLDRRVSHVKVVFDGRAACKAKVYLSAMHRYRRTAEVALARARAKC